MQLSGVQFRCRLSDTDNAELHSSLQSLQQQGGCEQLLDLLNQYFEIISAAVSVRGGLAKTGN